MKVELFLFVGEPSSVFKKANFVSMSKEPQKMIIPIIFWGSLARWHQNSCCYFRKWNWFWGGFLWQGVGKVWVLRFTTVGLWNGKSELCREHHTLFKPSLSNCPKKKAKKSIIEIFVLGQIVETANPPEDISTYVLKENKVKMIRPKV